jgi:alpha-N-arabinofuranosidase
MPVAEAADVVLDSKYTIGPVDRRMFGSFVEHMGRCVYSGIYEPGHPTADRDGFRGDVLRLVQELGVSTVRYPGGNFVSNYRWEDGIGPRGDRPRRSDIAWKSIETNEFGLDEFMAWCRRAEVEPMLAVNLGTRGVAAAVDMLEYCNLPEGMHYADLRARHGSAEPYGVRLWCLGNEMDGPWQVGQKTAEEYGRLARQVAAAMRRADPTLELVACGSSEMSMPTFGSWEATVLRHCYDVVDYLSLHAYYQQRGDDRASYLASGEAMSRFIEAVVATADHIRAVGRHASALRLSFDEWNVRHEHNRTEEDERDWQVAPPIAQDEFTATDATVVGGLLIALLNHADRVGVACQAQLVNVLGLIRTEPSGPAWRQSIFHPFAGTAQAARGTVLRPAVTCPNTPTDAHGAVPIIDVAATAADDGQVAVFAVNRSPDSAVTVSVALQNLPDVAVAQHRSLACDDAAATNTAADPHRVAPTSAPVSRTRAGFSIDMPPGSWSQVILTPA